MKSVTLDALRLQRLGDRKNPRDIGQVGVKLRVEACRLRKAGELSLREADDGQGRWNVERCVSIRAQICPPFRFES